MIIMSKLKNLKDEMISRDITEVELLFINLNSDSNFKYFCDFVQQETKDEKNNQYINRFQELNYIHTKTGKDVYFVIAGLQLYDSKSSKLLYQGNELPALKYDPIVYDNLKKQVSSLPYYSGMKSPFYGRNDMLYKLQLIDNKLYIRDKYPLELILEKSDSLADIFLRDDDSIFYERLISNTSKEDLKKIGIRNIFRIGWTLIKNMNDTNNKS